MTTPFRARGAKCHLDERDSAAGRRCWGPGGELKPVTYCDHAGLVITAGFWVSRDTPGRYRNVRRAPGRRGNATIFFVPGALMPVCPAVPCNVTPAPAGQAGPGLPGGAGMVAVRVADLRSPAGAGRGKDARTALVPAGGTGKIRTGDAVVFLKPVAIAPAVVRRDGRVQA